MPPTPVLDQLVGSWVYGEPEEKYTITKCDAGRLGRLHFDERHCSGRRARGELRPCGRWFVAELRSEDDEPIGEIRLRVQGLGALLSNFKGLKDPSWGADTVARKGIEDVAAEAPLATAPLPSMPLTRPPVAPGSLGASGSPAAASLLLPSGALPSRSPAALSSAAVASPLAASGSISSSPLQRAASPTARGGAAVRAGSPWPGASPLSSARRPRYIWEEQQAAEDRGVGEQEEEPWWAATRPPAPAGPDQPALSPAADSGRWGATSLRERAPSPLPGWRH